MNTTASSPSHHPASYPPTSITLRLPAMAGHLDTGPGRRYHGHLRGDDPAQARVSL
ncbi:hypothetical protein IMZ48_03705 [Candidatus Bathyarchaeota archaeon]|nr:hypothetical protein [Candidatus Bathyarchaeota archaeon]